jgi:hypothetical protein
MANSDIEVANMALALLNEPEIQTLISPKTKNERIIVMYLQEVIDEICSYRAWNFCTRVVQLAEDVGNDIDYLYRYVVPNNPKTLRVLGFKTKFGTFDPEWVRRGDFILTDETPCIMEIIHRPVHINNIPAYMTRAIVTMLASRIAVAVLGIDGGGLANNYENMLYQNILPNAVMLDEQEGHRRHEEMSSVLGGSVIDGDYYGDTSPLSMFGEM